MTTSDRPPDAPRREEELDTSRNRRYGRDGGSQLDLTPNGLDRLRRLMRLEPVVPPGAKDHDVLSPGRSSAAVPGLGDTATEGMGGWQDAAAGTAFMLTVCVAGRSVGRQVFTQGLVRIGRGADCDLLIDDLHVSRYHALIERQAPGRFVIFDQLSSNGTRVNGEKIARPHRLRDGDVVTIGRVTIMFQCDLLAAGAAGHDDAPSGRAPAVADAGAAAGPAAPPGPAAAAPVAPATLHPSTGPGGSLAPLASPPPGPWQRHPSLVERAAELVRAARNRPQPTTAALSTAAAAAAIAADDARTDAERAAARADAVRAESARADAARADAASRAESARAESARAESARAESARMDAARGEAAPQIPPTAPRPEDVPTHHVNRPAPPSDRQTPPLSPAVPVAPTPRPSTPPLDPVIRTAAPGAHDAAALERSPRSSTRLPAIGDPAAKPPGRVPQGGSERRREAAPSITAGPLAVPPVAAVAPPTPAAAGGTEPVAAPSPMDLTASGAVKRPPPQTEASLYGRTLNLSPRRVDDELRETSAAMRGWLIGVETARWSEAHLARPAARHVLERDVLLIGSGPECEVRIDGWLVPRVVAVVVRGQEGFGLVQVAGWPHEARVNGRVVPDRDVLEDGDVIDVCGRRWRFQRAAA